jgi:hypothetical protein
MDKEREEFLKKFSEIRNDKETFKILKDFHMQKVNLYNDNLKQELKEEIYRPFIFAHQINDNLNGISLWIKLIFQKSKIIPSDDHDPVPAKFKTIIDNAQAFGKLKSFFINNNKEYLNDLKILLRNQKFNKYIAYHQIEPYAHLVKQLLEKIKTKPTIFSIPAKLKSYKTTLLEVLNSPEFKVLKDKTKDENQEESKNKLKSFLKDKFDAYVSSEGITNKDGKISHKDVLLKLLSGDSFKTRLEDVREFKSTLRSKGINEALKNKSDELIRDTILEMLPSDNRVSTGSNYYKDKVSGKEDAKRTMLKGGKRKKKNKKKRTLKISRKSFY